MAPLPAQPGPADPARPAPPPDTAQAAVVPAGTGPAGGAHPPMGEEEDDEFALRHFFPYPLLTRSMTDQALPRAPWSAAAHINEGGGRTPLLGVRAVRDDTDGRAAPEEERSDERKIVENKDGGEHKESEAAAVVLVCYTYPSAAERRADRLMALADAEEVTGSPASDNGFSGLWE